MRMIQIFSHQSKITQNTIFYRHTACSCVSTQISTASLYFSNMLTIIFSAKAWLIMIHSCIISTPNWSQVVNLCLSTIFKVWPTKNVLKDQQSRSNSVVQTAKWSGDDQFFPPWPGNTPDLNLIQNRWSILKKWELGGLIRQEWITVGHMSQKLMPRGISEGMKKKDQHWNHWLFVYLPIKVFGTLEIHKIVLHYNENM